MSIGNPSEICVAVTGATGFIGRAVVSGLLGDGYQVRALVRPTSAKKPIAANVQRVFGDLTDERSLATFVDGANAVIHCAGVVRGANRDHFMRHNSDATGLLGKLAARACIERVVYLSSLAATLPNISYYAESKLNGEQALLAALDHRRCAIIRPSAVYGPGDREIRPLFVSMSHGFAPIFAPPTARFSMLYVADLVSAVLACLRTEADTSEPMECHDGRSDGYTMDDIIKTAEEVFTRQIHRVTVPRLALRAFAHTNLTFSKIFGYAPMLTPWKIKELSHPRWVCDNTSLANTLTWQPAVRLDEGIRLSLRADFQ